MSELVSTPGAGRRGSIFSVLEEGAVYRVNSPGLWPTLDRDRRSWLGIHLSHLRITSASQQQACGEQRRRAHYLIVDSHSELDLCRCQSRHIRPIGLHRFTHA